MADKSVADRVKEIIVEQLGVNPDQVAPEAKFIEDLGADSLDTVELVMAFEEEFGATPRSSRPSAMSSSTSKNAAKSKTAGGPRTVGPVTVAGHKVTGQDTLYAPRFSSQQEPA